MEHKEDGVDSTILTLLTLLRGVDVVDGESWWPVPIFRHQSLLAEPLMQSCKGLLDQLDCTTRLQLSVAGAAVVDLQGVSLAGMGH